MPGRSGKAYRDWLEEHGEAFRAGGKVATLDPFHGYKNAINDQPDDATTVLDQVYIAWQCAQRLRCACHTSSMTEGRRIAGKVLASFPTCPIPEIERLGTILKRWRDAFLAYFDTGRASNDGTEAVNGLIELQRRIT